MTFEPFKYKFRKIAAMIQSRKMLTLFKILIGISTVFVLAQCQKFVDYQLKPISHQDEYLSLYQYNEYDLGQVADSAVYNEFDSYKEIIDTDIVPFQPIVDYPLVEDKLS